MDLKKIAAIVDNYKGEKGILISILQDIQAEYHYLPEEALRYLSGELKIPLSQIYAVATFYTAFSLKPKGRHMIHLCTGTACHVKGAERILTSLENKLGITAGETTSDGQFSMEKVRCLGCCSLSPVMAIDKTVYGHLSPEETGKIFKKYSRKGEDK
jgi:NADH:ubiquinone oxidoreductase subunit E